MHECDIILLDDDPDDHIIFLEICKELKMPINLVSHFTVEALIKHLEIGGRPHVIFLDLNISPINGQECLVLLKSHEKWRDIPVVIYSTASREEIVQDCLAQGAEFFLVKPSDTATLRQSLISILRKYNGAT